MDSDNRKRRLIAFGASDFDMQRDGFDPLPDADEEITRIEALFRRCGFQSVCTGIRLNSSADEIKTAICEFLSDNDLERRDVLALYFTGHGDVNDSVYYLCPRGTRRGQLYRTAIEASELVRWIYSSDSLPPNRRPGNVMVVLDACYAAEAARDLLKTIADKLRRVVPEGEGGVVLICTARTKERAYPRAFARAFGRSREHGCLCARQQQYLGVFQLVAGVNARQDARQQAELNVFASAGKEFFLLNPRYDPDYVGRSLEDAERSERRAHFDPRSRGVEGVEDRGDFFAGRHAARRVIADFLGRAGGGPGLLVVTGDPGSGKSAVLGRIDSDAPPGTIDHTIHVRRMTTSAVIERLAVAAAVSAITAAELVKAIGHFRERLHIVVDALDEADNPPEIATDILVPLAALPGVRLVVGTRRPQLDWLVTERVAVDLVDLDEATYFDPEDLQEYVERRLLGIEHSPYANVAPRARAVARAVVARAGHSFLVAAVHARSLADLPPVDPDDPAWLDALASDVGEAFKQDLRNRFAGYASLVQHILRPLAFAFGRGLPQESLWPDVASRIAGIAITTEQIDDVKRRAGFYITPDTEDGVGVYRLYHERFAEHLRAIPDESQAHAAFVACLRDTVPANSGAKRQWHLARPYTLRHLARHALESGQLAELIREAAYVVHAAPGELRAAVLQSPQARRSPVGEIFLLAADRLQRAANPGERSEQLRMEALRQEYFELAGEFCALELLRHWRVRWTQLPMSTPNVLLGRHLDSCTCVAFGPIDGDPVVVSGSDDQTVRLWDARTGQPRGQPLRGHEHGVSSVSLGVVDGDPVVVSGSHDNTVRLWDARTGQPRGQPLRGHENWVTSVSLDVVDGEPVVVSGSWDNTVRLWDARTGQPRGQPLRGHEDWVNSVSLGVVDGDPVVVSGSDDNTVRLWDARTGQPRGQPLRGHGNSVNSVSLGMVDGDPVVVSGSDDQTVRLWDARTGQPRGQPLRGHEGRVNSVSLGVVDGDPVVVSGSRDYTVRLWDRSGEPRGQPLRGHEDWVTSVSLGVVDGEPVVVSGSRDYTVRLWDALSGQPRGQPLRGHENGVTSVSLGMVDGDPVVVSGSLNRTVRLWDARSGEPRGQPLRGHEDWVNSVSLGVVDSDPVVVSGSLDQTVRLWDARTGQPRGQPLRGHEGWVDSVSLGVADGDPVVVSGSGDQTVRLWDARTGEPRGQPLRGHEHWVYSVSLGVVDGDAVVVSGSADGTVRLWDARTGQPRGQPLRGHEDGVTSVSLGVVDGDPVVVSGSHDYTVRLWDARTGQPRGQPLRGHENSVHSVSLGVVDGDPVVVSGSDDQTVRLWDARTGEQFGVISASVTSVCMLPGTRLLVIGTTQGLMMLELFPPSG